jgi:thiamine-phosphate pyrophosphorylase
MASSRFELRGLYAVTPAVEDTAALSSRVEAAIAGGAALVQYRAKTLAPDRALEQARRLAALCRARRVAFIVNDSVDLALAVSADGVHVGRDDMSAEAVRKAMPGAIVGVSCYDQPRKARDAAAAGADYVGIGSLFASPTKPGAVRAGLADIAVAQRAGGIPVAAIGGIDAGNVATVVDAGAEMVAVISSLFDAPDVEAAARALARPFGERARRQAHG